MIIFVIFVIVVEAVKPTRNRTEPNQIAICISGQLRTLVGVESILRRVVCPLQADVFIVVHKNYPKNYVEMFANTLKPISIINTDEPLNISNIAGVSKYYYVMKSYPGYHTWIKPNNLYQYYDLEQCYDGIIKHENQRNVKYKWIIRTRPDIFWVIEHPVISIFESKWNSSIWVPEGSEFNGINDRHAVVPRNIAESYFRRWSYLRNGDALKFVGKLNKRPNVCYSWRRRAYNFFAECYLMLTITYYQITTKTFPGIQAIILPNGKLKYPYEMATAMINNYFWRTFGGYYEMNTRGNLDINWAGRHNMSTKKISGLWQSNYKQLRNRKLLETMLVVTRKLRQYKCSL
eukprot:NODE_2698_length_1514_cov_40.649892_g2324_i0.p1 GENE.NODE_2698_length_1514_cov_40.649892_g2324_i0~~NODE_2698_length_1514_cov_40.649892_g2324_i0.p1  ORF type:complete len:347 (+),score=16.93 NODE_2698_length_1514_cov_40.649892_g2324_i0:40-1080(+)